MAGHESAGGWSRPRAKHLSLPELPCLALEHILIHCSSSDLAFLRCCSRDNRRMVDRTVTKLFPWLVVISPSPSATQPAVNDTNWDDYSASQRSKWRALTPSTERHCQNPLMTDHRSGSLLQTAQAEVPLSPPTKTTATGTSGNHSNISEAGLGPQESLTQMGSSYISRGRSAQAFLSAGSDSGLYNFISELVLRHHPHLDRCLDPSSASYGQQLHHSGGLSSSSTQLQTIHLPCRLRTTAAGLAGAAAALPTRPTTAMQFAGCLAAIPSLTSLSACLMCLVDIPAAREAARSDMGQHWLSLMRGSARQSAWAVAGMSRSASWLAQQHEIRMQHLQESELARQTELHVNQQLLAVVRQLPSLAQRLVQLTLTEMPYVGETFEAVAACSALTRLVLSGWVPDFVGGPFAAASNRPGVMVSEHLAALVNGLPRLRHLDLHAPAFIPALDFGILSALTGLTFLRLNQATLYDAMYGTRFERLPSDFLPEPLLGPLRGIERIAGLPQLHSLALTGLDCPPRDLLEALPRGGGPLRLLALRKLYRLTSDHLNALGALTNLTELQLAADWCLHPGRDAPPPLDLQELAGDLENGPMMMVDIGGEDIGLLFAQVAPLVAGPQGGGDGGGDGGGAPAGAAADPNVAGQQQQQQQQESVATDVAQGFPAATAAAAADRSASPSITTPTAAGAATSSKPPASNQKPKTRNHHQHGRPADDDEPPTPQHDEDATHGTAGPSTSAPPAAAPQAAAAPVVTAIPGTAAAAAAASVDAAHARVQEGPGQPAQAPLQDRGPDLSEGREEPIRGQEPGQLPQAMEMEIDWEVWDAEAAAPVPNHMQQQQQEGAPADAPEAAGAPGVPPVLQPQPALINAANGGGWVFLPGAALLFGGLAGGGAAAGIGDVGVGGGDRGGQQRDERLGPLRRLRNLQVLHLDIGRIFGVVNMGPRFLDHLSAITSLTSLSLRCATVDWSLLSVLAPLPRLAHLSMQYYDGRGNDGKKIAANLLTWHNLSAVTTLQLGTFEARLDADIITRVLPRTRLAAASVFGMWGWQPGYDVFSALAQTTSLTSLSVKGDWMVPRATRNSAASAPTATGAHTAQTLSELRRLPLLRSLSLDFGGGDNALIEGGVHAPAFQDVIWMMAGIGQQGGGAHGPGGGGGGALMGMPPPPPPPLPPPLMLPLPPFPMALQPPPPPIMVQLPPVALQPLAQAHQQLEQPPYQRGHELQQQQQEQEQEQQRQHGGVADASLVTRGMQTVGSCVSQSVPEEQVRGVVVDPQVASPPPPAAAATPAPGPVPTAPGPATGPSLPWRPTFKEVPVLFEEESDSEEERLAPARLLRAAVALRGAAAAGPRAVAPASSSRGSRNRNNTGAEAASNMQGSTSPACIADGLDMLPHGADSAEHTRDPLHGATAAIAPISASPPPAWASGSSGSESDHGWDILGSLLGATRKGTRSRIRSRSRVGAAAHSAVPRPSPSSASVSVPPPDTAEGDSRSSLPVTAKGHKRRAGRVEETAAAAATAAATPVREVEAPELTPAGHWLIQVSELPQLTSLRLERCPALPPLALAPLTGLQRLQLVGLESLDEKLLEVLSHLPVLTYLTLEGQTRGHIGSSVYRALTRTPYIRDRSVGALGTLTRLRLLVLSGFSLVPPPKQCPSELQPRLSQLFASARRARTPTSAAAARNLAADLAAIASASAAAVTASTADWDGSGTRESRRKPRYSPYRAASCGDVNDDHTKAKLERLVESLGRLKGLRYLSLCIADNIEASELVRLCGLLPGLRMLNLPADATSRPKLPQLRPWTLQRRRGAPGACSAVAAPNETVRRRGGGGGGGGGGGLKDGNGDDDDDDDDDHDKGQGKRESVRKGKWKPFGGDAGPSGHGSAAGAAAAAAGSGGNDGAGPSQPPPPRRCPPPPPPPRVPPTKELEPLERSFTEQLEGLTAAVYSGLSEGEFWRVVDGLDVEIRVEGALLGASAGANRLGIQSVHLQL
ncbi:hypothetical protein VaNZ11_005223 [Volvox africanus]|uniref:F-box domain-containing protein n=1 Tax=Volvox africanus TaxID=51714 RepID=A0ABQ5RZW9_9CHLO|nr:hypothetical protein VaNZ11_005223 [Volvox africanus]